MDPISVTQAAMGRQNGNERTVLSGPPAPSENPSSALSASDKALRGTDPVGQIRRQLLEMADVESIDSIAGGFLRAAQMECIVDSPPYPPVVCAFLYRLLIHFRCQSHDLKIGEYIQGEQFPCLGRINRRSKWRARQNGIQLRKTMTTDVSSDRFLANHLQSRQGLSVMGMVSHGRRHQNGCVKVRVHIPEASLILSSRIDSTRLPQSKPRGTLPK